MRAAPGTRLRPLALAAVAVLLAGSTAFGKDDVNARLSAAFVYEDGAVEVRVEIGEMDEPLSDVRLTVPEGFRAEGPFGGMRRTTIIGGERRTVTEVGFRVTPAPGAEGEYAIGPVVLVKRSGKTLEVPVGTVRVGRRPERGVRFEVLPDRPSGPVLMPFIARYRVLFSGRVEEGEDVFGSARNPMGLTALSIQLLGRTDVKVEAGPALPGAPASAVRLGEISLKVYEGFEEIDGAIWRALEFALQVTPLTTGEIDLAGEVGMSLVEGVERRRDFFGRIVEVPVAREHRAKTAPAVYRVEELPSEGRPAGFTGAVGRFTIEADPEPREMNAFDPIRVTVTVRGRGVLDRVGLPRWSAFREIARDFEVDADVDPGKVEGSAKVFQVVFRARSSSVTRLPSLPLPYYDPWKRAYGVALSEPVPLKVKDVKTVRPEDAVGAPARAPSAALAEPIGRRLGIGANFETADEEPASISLRPPLFTPAFLLLLAGPAAIAALFLLLDVLRSRPKDVPRGTPLARAIAGLEDAPSPDRVSALVAGYFRERLELGEGELTTREIERGLTGRSVPPALVARVAAIHDSLVASRFADGKEPQAGIEDVLREVDRCLG